MNPKANFFRTRVSLFYSLLVIIGTISLGAIAVYTWKSNDQDELLFSGGFLLILWGLMVGSYFSTSYHFEQYNLVVRGDFRGTFIPYLQIQQIYQREINPFFKGYNRKNSRKCGMGLRMIVIIYKINDVEKRIMISPKNEEIFLQELYQRAGKN